jgi:beta-N-acetylhexosaminidase
MGSGKSLAEQVGRRMRAAGVTMDLAPVLDLSDGPDAADPDGPRSFSINASIATAYGLAFARGLQEGGVIPVVKHFPSLG